MYFRVYLRSKCKTCYLVLIYTHTLAQIQRPPVLMEEALSMSEKAVLNLEGKSNHSAHLFKLDQKKVIEINFLSLSIHNSQRFHKILPVGVKEI